MSGALAGAALHGPHVHSPKPPDGRELGTCGRPLRARLGKQRAAADSSFLAPLHWPARHMRSGGAQCCSAGGPARPVEPLGVDAAGRVAAGRLARGQQRLQRLRQRHQVLAGGGDARLRARVA